MAVLVFTFLSFAGCASQDTPTITWDPVDYDEIVHQVENPTGELGAGALGEIKETTEATLQVNAEQLDTIFELLASLQSSVQVLIDAMKESDPEGTASIVEGPVSAGTRVQIKASCAGPDLENPNTEFEHGTMRIIGVTASLDEIIENGLSLNGHMLVAFDNCTIGEITLNGENPAFFDDSNNIVAMQFDTSMELAGETINFEHAIIFTDGGYMLLMNSYDVGSYSFVVETADFQHFLIKAADGDYGCLANEMDWECGLL